jgi:imidazolonepropionase-like amidohydrolase
MYVNCGPRSFFFDRAERKIVGSMYGWAKEGVKKLGVNTDCVGFDGVDFTPGEDELVYQAALGVRLGLDDTSVALRALTINPARSGNIGDRVGSLEKGKDADIGVWSGNPVDPRSYCRMTIIEGDIVYDTQRDGQRW